MRKAPSPLKAWRQLALSQACFSARDLISPGRFASTLSREERRLIIVDCATSELAIPACVYDETHISRTSQVAPGGAQPNEEHGPSFVQRTSIPTACDLRTHFELRLPLEQRRTARVFKVATCESQPHVAMWQDTRRSARLPIGTCQSARRYRSHALVAIYSSRLAFGAFACALAVAIERLVQRRN